MNEEIGDGIGDIPDFASGAHQEDGHHGTSSG